MKVCLSLHLDINEVAYKETHRLYYLDCGGAGFEHWIAKKVYGETVDHHRHLHPLLHHQML